MRFSASASYVLPTSFRLEHAGEVRDSGVSAWHKTQSSQFVVATDDFSDDEDGALISTSLIFLDMAKDSDCS